MYIPHWATSGSQKESVSPLKIVLMARDLSAGCFMVVIQYMFGVGVHKKPKNRDRFRSKPKTEYKTIITEEFTAQFSKP